MEKKGNIGKHVKDGLYITMEVRKIAPNVFIILLTSRSWRCNDMTVGTWSWQHLWAGENSGFGDGPHMKKIESDSERHEAGFRSRHEAIIRRQMTSYKFSNCLGGNFNTSYWASRRLYTFEILDMGKYDHGFVLLVTQSFWCRFSFCFCYVPT